MPADSPTPLIVAAARTPLGTAGRSLAHVPAHELAAPVLARLAKRLPVPPDEVILGNCLGPGGDVARVATLAAGLPDGVPALTVDRQCASGLAAIGLGAALVRAGAGTVIAGGVESASTAPWRMWPPQGDGEPTRYERAPFAPKPERDPDMGLAADLLAEEHGIGRSDQDAYAARSHARAHAAQEAGLLDAEIVPVGGLTRDERVRAGLSVDRLARLRPTYRPGGSVTAGNACGINDGAAAVAIVPDDGVTPGLRILATAEAGVAPERPGLGLVPATRMALERAGVGLDEIDRIELNEAFAGQILACCSVLGLDPARVCPDGGALALGHPWGASGAVLMVRLWHGLMAGSGRFGLAAIAAGGGQGSAAVVEVRR